MHFVKTSFTWSCLSALTLMGLVGCSKPTPLDEPVRAVKLVTVGAQSLSSAHEFAGEVRARVESRLGFRVAGKLTQRAVELGQRVSTGQLLAVVDAQDYRLAQEAAAAQLASARSNRDVVLADYQRFKELKAQNFISSAELERRDSAVQAAQAQWEQARAQLAAQTNQVGYTTLRADAPGVVTALDAEVGQVVGVGTPIVRIARDGARDVVFAVPEDKLTAVALGTPVAVRAWGSTQPVVGKIYERAASADPQTRTFAVKVALDAQATLPLGSTVTVLPQVAGAAAQAIKLPTSALRQDGQRSAVWVLDAASMTVQSQPVQIATADGNDVVIAAGLQPGMQVVVAGVHVLSPGQKVTIYKNSGAAVSPQAK